LKIYCLPKVRNQHTYTNYPKVRAADWDEQLIFAAYVAKTNEQQNLAFLSDLTTWNAFCTSYLCFISDDLLLWRILEDRQLDTHNVQTFNKNKFPIEN
jgi:hypothetical protein